jgi:hypothetical protein
MRLLAQLVESNNALSRAPACLDSLDARAA